MACGGVLDEVTICPRFVSRHDLLYFRYVLSQVEVERSPVPARVEGDGLSFATTGGQYNRLLVAAAIDQTMREDDITIGGEVVDLTG